MFNKLRNAVRFLKALQQIEDIKKEVEIMDSKALLKSKTFWFNILTLAATFADVLPAKWAIPVSAVVNMGLRLVTNQPVHLFPPDSK